MPVLPPLAPNADSRAFADRGVCMPVAPVLIRLFGAGRPDCVRLPPSSESLSGLLGRPPLTGLAGFPTAADPNRSAAAAVEPFAPRSLAFMFKNRCALLPAVILPSALSASSADVFALRRPSSSASPSAIDLRGRRREVVPLLVVLPCRPASDEVGRLRALLEGALAGVDAVLDRLREPGVVEGGRFSPATDERPERLESADCGRAVASVGGSVDSRLTLCAGQKMPLPASQAKYCTLEKWGAQQSIAKSPLPRCPASLAATHPCTLPSFLPFPVLLPISSRPAKSPGLKVTGPRWRRTPMREVPSMTTSSPISSALPLFACDEGGAYRPAAVGVGMVGTLVGVIEPLLGVEGAPKDCRMVRSERLLVSAGPFDVAPGTGRLLRWGELFGWVLMTAPTPCQRTMLRRGKGEGGPARMRPVRLASPGAARCRMVPRRGDARVCDLCVL